MLDPDEPPPEPPETLNVLEHQRYISKLIQWGFEASKRERSRPHLVDRDNDPEGLLTAPRYAGVSQDTAAWRPISPFSIRQPWAPILRFHVGLGQPIERRCLGRLGEGIQLLGSEGQFIGRYGRWFSLRVRRNFSPDEPGRSIGHRSIGHLDKYLCGW